MFSVLCVYLSIVWPDYAEVQWATMFLNEAAMGPPGRFKDVHDDLQRVVALDPHNHEAWLKLQEPRPFCLQSPSFSPPLLFDACLFVSTIFATAAIVWTVPAGLGSLSSRQIWAESVTWWLRG